MGTAETWQRPQQKVSALDKCTRATRSDIALFEEQLSSIEFALHNIIHENPTRAMLRVWVPCCGNGLSASQIAAMALKLAGDSRRVRVFATDSDRMSVAAARQGRFESSGPLPLSLEGHVSAAEGQWR